MPYVGDILELTRRNADFREVIATGPNSQVVVMCLPPGGEIGLETHTQLDQVLVIVDGNGAVLLDGQVSPIGPGTLIQVAAGVSHNVTNTGTSPMRLYTVYAPPAHLPGTVHRTKADADRDEADHPVVGATR
jgi:mannose-6-phosphate isomerase-like protein (cupin superfamily)